MKLFTCKNQPWKSATCSGQSAGRKRRWGPRVSCPSGKPPIRSLWDISNPPIRDTCINPAFFAGMLRCNQRWARNLKIAAPQKQNAIYKTRAQYAKCIALLHYLKRIASKQLMLRMQIFAKKHFKVLRMQPQLLRQVNVIVDRIRI